MTHAVDGYDLAFTSRTSWKAERRRKGQLIDIVPMTWTKGWRRTSEGIFLRVWFRHDTDLQNYNARIDPFIVAVAVAKNYTRVPHKFAAFTALFRVVATGKILSERSIETRLLDRVRAI